MPPWVIAAIGVAWGIISSLIAWGYATGVFVGSAPSKADLRTLKDEVDEDICDLGRRLTGEHDERKRQIELLAAQVGAMQLQQARQDERLKVVERLRGMPPEGMAT